MWQSPLKIILIIPNWNLHIYIQHRSFTFRLVSVGNSSSQLLLRHFCDLEAHMVLTYNHLLILPTWHLIIPFHYHHLLSRCDSGGLNLMSSRSKDFFFSPRHPESLWAPSPIFRAIFLGVKQPECNVKQ
jgi:hypothetical protein